MAFIRILKMRSGKKFEKEDRALDRAAGKREMEAIAPVTVEARDPQEEDDERENEAMRIGNIVRAEVSAAKVKEQLEALRKSNEEEYNRLIQNPAEIAKMFWTEMYPPDQRIIRREGTIHQNNKYRMPESTIYGRDYFTHVVNTLGNGVTTEILKKQTPARKEYQPGPNQKLR